MTDLSDMPLGSATPVVIGLPGEATIARMKALKAALMAEGRHFLVVADELGTLNGRYVRRMNDGLGGLRIVDRCGRLLVANESDRKLVDASEKFS